MPLTSNALTRRLRRFRADTGGSMSVEAAIWIPTVVLILVAVFILFDAVRAKSMNDKAAFAIADAISRETEALDDEYIDGMTDLAAFVTQSDGNDQHGLRVTVVRYHAPSDKVFLEWSEGRGALNGFHNHPQMWAAMQGRFPEMSHSERLIIVETQMEHRLPVDVLGLNDYTFEGFAMRRPRFAPQIEYERRRGRPSV